MDHEVICPQATMEWPFINGEKIKGNSVATTSFFLFLGFPDSINKNNKNI
jgi:hypothetical protein